MSWLVSYGDLTAEQLGAVEAPWDRHRMLVGGPGSGKTLVLLHRAAWLRQKYKIPEDRYRIFVFTNVLRQYIQSGCLDLGISIDNVMTFDNWCMNYFEENIGKNVPWDAARKHPDFALVREAVLDHVKSSRTKLFDFVMVDEGQDLSAQAYAILTAVSNHVTVAVDAKQQIYVDGLSEPEIARCLGLARRNLSLLSAYRCSPYVASLAAAFVADAVEAKQFLRQTQTTPARRETPVLYTAKDIDDEKNVLVEMIRNRLVMGESLAVLLPTRKQVFGFSTTLEQAGIEVESHLSGGLIDFSNGKPKILTYHSAKGLTFDTVLLPRIIRKSFMGHDTASVHRLLFVAVTRATKWAFLSTYGKAVPDFLDCLKPLIDAGELTLRRPAERPSPARSRAGDSGGPAVDFTDIL